jgi:hypothetical protein
MQSYATRHTVLKDLHLQNFAKQSSDSRRSIAVMQSFLTLQFNFFRIFSNILYVVREDGEILSPGISHSSLTTYKVRNVRKPQAKQSTMKYTITIRTLHDLLRSRIQ